MFKLLMMAGLVTSVARTTAEFDRPVLRLPHRNNRWRSSCSATIFLSKLTS